MNDRIRELVVESGNGQMRDGKLYPHIGSRTEADWKRFAELIVQECSYLADQAHKKATGGKSAGGYIRQHFGVGE